ncbi:MAG: hypothetical protein AVDCRST_MAG68-5094 [uncultured Gemmatimonadetes bacterium]|uniref:Tyr recombinase domain-containing protein n=1 Tax=uncultured Gemmatimonadota bacterium TaxID=203437 RepID=A0A6J4MP96_9BACT|nr:MAG: hypothetical protein AVDCRST_MAG68-5094 [uncultured Gemmatimonadota bacterium]
MSVAREVDRGGADFAVSAATQAHLDEAVPENTRRAYRWAWGRFTVWCQEVGRTALPCSAETLVEHVTHLRALGAKPATIDQAIGVILAEHNRVDAVLPRTKAARDSLRGYRRQLAEEGWTPKQATPFTEDSLRQTIAALDPATLRGRRDHLLLVFGFEMMARRSELAALAMADVVDGPEGLEVRVRWSKTDKQSQGRVVALPAQKDAALDPVRLFRAWRAERGDEGPLLCHLDLNGRVGGRLTGAGVNHAVRAAVKRAGLPDPDTYTAHSLRAGGLTDALRRGVLLGIAARHGGWDPESPTVLRYARAADRWRDNAMAGAF